MTLPVKLPNPTVFQFYEGSSTALYTRLTGTNLNRAPNAILSNTALLALVTNALAGYAADYDIGHTYQESEPCKSGGVIYISLTSENLGNPVDNPTYWIPVVGNINDQVVSDATTWSSAQSQSEILSMAIALG